MGWIWGHGDALDQSEADPEVGRSDDEQGKEAEDEAQSMVGDVGTKRLARGEIIKCKKEDGKYDDYLFC